MSANDSGELPESWAPVLDSKRLLWISADGYGNSKPSAERVLVVLMAYWLARQIHATDHQRVYVAGFSGGGRIASICITQMQRYFTGALFISGADFTIQEELGRHHMEGERLVFLTGNRDFNQREMKRVHERYRKAGLKNTLLMDEHGFGHELANAAQLGTAIDFLDSR